MTSIALDAAALVSAFVTPGGEAEAIYRGTLEGDTDLVTSPDVLLEFATLLTERFGWDPVMAGHAVMHVARVAAEARSSRGTLS